MTGTENNQGKGEQKRRTAWLGAEMIQNGGNMFIHSIVHQNTYLFHNRCICIYNFKRVLKIMTKPFILCQTLFMVLKFSNQWSYLMSGSL